MTERGKYVSNWVENARMALGGGVILLQGTRSYGYENEPEKMTSYEQLDIEFEDHIAPDGISQLAALAVTLKNLPEDGAFDKDYDSLLEYVMEWASETAEEAEVPFTFTDVQGKINTYTPASLWEASGGCEWEESAQYGYDYGWNV